MARPSKIEEERPPHDALEGVPLPRQTTELFGHDEAETQLLAAYRSGRMPHGWIFSGERGIGRATLAFRLARFVFAHPDPASREVADATSLFVPPGHPAAKRVAASAHGNLLHLQREWNSDRNRYFTQLSVGTVRRIIPFLGASAGEGGWRVVIVDPADDMNPSAGNAILKNLEEPPQRTLFLLIASTAGGLLPTIVSRCRTLRLNPLAADDMTAALERVAPEAASGRDAELAIALAEGSPRRLIEIHRSGGIELYRLMRAAIESGDRAAQLRLSSLAGDAAGVERFAGLFEAYLGRRLRGSPEPEATGRAGSAPLVTLAALWEKATLSGLEVETYNLDRRQFVLDLLEDAAAAFRQSEQPIRA